MVSVVRATATEDYIKYPAKEDLQSMARRLVSYYPMLSDKLDLQRPWFKLFKRLNKRMQNIRTPRKSQGATPARGKKRRLEFGATEGEDEDDFDSSASTVIPSPSCSSTISSQEGDPQVITSTPVKQADVLVECRQDSRMAQARHYTRLKQLYRKTKQNRDDVAQLLDLEFEGRRAFIDSDTMREQDRPAKILEA
ncbi:unnamed protein product [Arctogadus glacialis]